MRKDTNHGAVATVALLALLALCHPCLAQGTNPANKFDNPSFEMGRQSWDLDKGGKTVARLDVNTDDAADGAYSALVTVEKVDSWGVQFGQKMEAGAKGKTYTLAALVKSAGDPVKVRLQIERSADPYDRAAATDAITVTKDGWTELHVTFTVAKDFREGWFSYLSCEQANAKFRADLFRLYEGEYVPYKQIKSQQAAITGVSIFDTGAAGREAMAGELIAARSGWAQIPEDKTDHDFKGAAVVMNSRIALALRSKAAGVELYAITPAGVEKSCVLKAAGESAELSAVKIIENTSAGAAVEASYKTAAGKSLSLRYELKMGQVFVKIEPGEGVPAVKVEAPCRFSILPDFFADDIVVDATALPVARAELPSENFLLQLLNNGNTVLMSVWNDREQDVVATLSGEGDKRRLDSADIPCGKKGKVWVAVLSGQGIWHQSNIARADAGKVAQMDWKAPMPAVWRLDFRREDAFADSWEMIVQQAGGEFMKYGFLGSPDRIPSSRKRWTTVLGSFLYPCWIDAEGRGWVQPLKADVKFDGAAVLYPLARVKNTPLEAFTVTDIVRATMGVGPCEYILDIEGQQSTYKGRATCANRDTLNPIYEKGQQAKKRAEIEQSLDEVMVFVRHIRSRIQGYVDFGHETLAYLAEQRKTHPELAKPIAELEALAGAIDQRLAKRKNAIKTPEEAQAMVDAFRKQYLDYAGADAFEQCRKFTAAMVEVGGNQDELVGECRLAIRILRQRAALAMAAEPRVAEIAREIRARSQKVLRNPAGHEGARH